TACATARACSCRATGRRPAPTPAGAAPPPPPARPRAARASGASVRETVPDHVSRRLAELPMSPSRPFILRPVATSLLMVALVLAGLVGFRFLPLSALSQGDYPTFQFKKCAPGESTQVK